MKVGVIGASGFIGSHVVEQLRKQDHSIVGYDFNPDWDFATEYMDIGWPWQTVRNHLKYENLDAVINLAGILGTHELFDNVSTAIRVNINGQYNVARACTDMEVPLVTIEQPHVWTNPYETTRGAGVRLARALAAHKGLRLATVQAYNAFGPRQAYGLGHPQKVVPTFAVRAWNKLPLRIYGSGNQMMNMIHAADLANILIAAIPHATTGDSPIFYGAAEQGNQSVNRLADMINGITKNPVEAEWLPMRPGETDDEFGASVPNASLFTQQRVLGVKAYYTFNQIYDTVKWYKDFEI